jgi:uncharacterized surface protein with fasciclin (FAS1) repeats
MKLNLNLVVSALLVGYSAGQTIVDVASSNSAFSTLVDFVVQADLADLLASTEGITVFAPTNDAFTALATAAPDVVANLGKEEWTNHLVDVLSYHVVAGEVPAIAVTDGMVATALNEESLTLTKNDEGIFVNSDSQVVIADVNASNGVIHAIDNVLTPSWVSNTIVDRAINSPALTTLVDLVVAAGLVETLSSPGPFTVFAPTDDAFVAFLDGADPASLDIDAVAAILTYHVVPGIYSAADITDGLSLTTVQGEDLTFSLMGSTAKVNDATIAAANILANNGIVHVIDTVLNMPVKAPEPTMAPVKTPAMEKPSSSMDTDMDMDKDMDKDDSAGYRSTFAAATATLVGFGVAIATAL